MKKYCIAFVFLCFALSAQARTLSIDIFGAGQQTVHLYIAPPLLGAGQVQPEHPVLFQEHLQNLLTYLPFFEFVPSSQIVGGSQLRGPNAEQIDFKRFSLSKVDMLVSIFWRGPENPGELGKLEARAFDVFSGSFMLGKVYTVYTGNQIPDIAARFSADLMKYMTGSSTFFESEIAYVQKKGKQKEVYTISPQGLNRVQRTSLNGICLSPAWSKDGQKIVFTYIDGKEHRLGLWTRQDGGVKTWVTPGNTCISPTFTPEGKMVASLDPKGTPNIYLINEALQIERALVESWSIDISPDFDSSGEKMSFVSSRLGNPHVFLFHSRSGQIQRLTYKGTYNTGASISPDGTKVAFSRMIDGHHRIFLLDVASGKEQQLTFGPGNDEEPCWSPDGFFLVFSSNRNGAYQLYLTDVHGKNIKHIPTGEGDATAPSWQVFAGTVSGGK